MSLKIKLKNLDFILYKMEESCETLIFNSCDIKENVKNHISILIQLFKLYFCLFLSIYSCMHSYQ